MIVTPIKTERIRPNTLDIFEVLDKFLPALQENTVIAITSKVVSICEGRLVPYSQTTRDELIKQESDYYIMDEESERRLTITKNILIPRAGIDASRYNRSYILWPEDPQASANRIRQHLLKTHNLKNVGIIITDSTTAPLVRGVRGIAIAHSGFLATKKGLSNVRVSIAQGLAAAAVVTMGEGAEQTPLAIISDVPFVQFTRSNPRQSELNTLNLDFKEDIYGRLLSSVAWQKGNKKV